MRLFCFWLALLFVIGQSGPISSIAADRPNVLLICVDDLKPVLGCYGDSTAITPNIDALASRSLRFDRAYCNQSLCSPSRNSLMTGLRPDTIGIYDLSTNFRKAVPDAITLAQHFQNNGYRTEAMGKIFHVGHGNHEDPASWTIPHVSAQAPSYANHENLTPPELRNREEPWKSPRGPAVEIAEVDDDFFVDGKIAVIAAERLAAAKGQNQPFFLAVGFIRPHLPFVAPKKYWDLYDRAKLPISSHLDAPVGAPEYALNFAGELRKYRGIPSGKDERFSEALTRELIHGYYAATSYTDACIGRVLTALEDEGFADNTIILLWGDHGWHLGDHSMWGKQTDYENAARIPLLISAPGKKAAVTSSFVETVDIYPTLAALARLPAPRGLDGKSFAPLFDDPSGVHRDHVIHVTPRSNLIGRAIRTDRYRLVEWKVPGASPATADYELYDYQDDPDELENRYETLPAVAEQLKAILATYPEAVHSIIAKPPVELNEMQKAALDKRIRAFHNRDKNGDGRLTLEEFLTRQPDGDAAAERFPKFDYDGDGFLSEEEYVKSGKL